MEAENIRVLSWEDGFFPDSRGYHSLFNSRALANANQLQGHTPFVLEVNDKEYLAYKRHASAVLGGLSLREEVELLENIPTLKQVLIPMGIRNLSLNTLNAVSDLDALARAIRLGCRVRFEYMLDLKHYAPGKISSNHKRNIKKSEKSGAKMILATGLDAMQEHLEIVNTNLGNKGVGGISSSAEFLGHLIEQESGLLVQVIEGGDLLASTFFVTNQDSAYYHSSGTSDRGKKIGAAHFLVDRMIGEMKKRNMDCLNLGGCTSEQAGLQRFKSGFRPEIRVLASISQQLSATGKQKIRSVLSMKARDVCRVERVNVYARELQDAQPANGEDYVLEKLSWPQLVSAISKVPELGDCLEQFCQSNAYCYALSDQQGKTLVVGFIEKGQASEISSPARTPVLANTADIIGQHFAHGALEAGVGPVFMGLLENEAMKLGLQRLVSRIDHQDHILRELLLAAGFSFAGEEKVVSSAILSGGSRVLGKVNA